MGMHKIDEQMRKINPRCPYKTIGFRVTWVFPPNLNIYFRIPR
jgi:hypothetical protein